MLHKKTGKCERRPHRLLDDFLKSFCPNRDFNFEQPWWLWNLLFDSFWTLRPGHSDDENMATEAEVESTSLGGCKKRLENAKEDPTGLWMTFRNRFDQIEILTVDSWFHFLSAPCNCMDFRAKWSAYWSVTDKIPELGSCPWQCSVIDLSEDSAHLVFKCPIWMIEMN